MKTSLIALATLSLAAFSGAAFAQAGGGMMGRMWTNADSNKDGVISKAEFDASRVQRFALMDGNKDGFVTEAEMRASAPNGGQPPPGAGKGQRQGGGMGARLDANGDGKISKAEFVDGGAMQFGRLDGNKDGKIDTTELANMRGPGGGGG